MDRTYWVCILASRPNGTLYVGVTNGLVRRVEQHRMKQNDGFTSVHDVDRLVFDRGFGDVHQAIKFEKQLKRWRRAWKVRLIEETNPHWADLYLELVATPPLHPDLQAIFASDAALTGSRSSAAPKPG